MLPRRQTIDPLTGRVTELYANAAYCRLAGGATVAAHLAQVAARALPEHVTHADHLCRSIAAPFPPSPPSPRQPRLSSHGLFLFLLKA